MTSDFTNAVLSHFTGDAASRAADYLAEYFDPQTPFTGSQFEHLADHDHPDQITAQDIVAVSTLSVDIPAAVSIWLLSDEGRQHVTEHLAEVPHDVDLWDAPELLDRGGDLWALWDLLGERSWPRPNPANGMGQTKKSKLLAAKRPRLVPVIDEVIRTSLPPVDDYWAAFKELVSDPDRRHVIQQATQHAPEHLSLLRRIDIVVWMAHRGQG